MDAGATDSRSRASTILRTFLAIELPPAARAEFAARQAALVTHLRHAGVERLLRWSDAHGYHLTLRFLGDTTPAQCTALAHALREITAAWSPLTLRLGEWGAFPHRTQPRVLWVGVVGETAPLAALQAQVEAAVQALGFPAETKPFAPHMTVARLRRDASRAEITALGRALEAYRDPAGTPLARDFVVEQLVHFRSDLRPSGAVYTPLALFPLARPDSQHAG